MKAEQAIEDLIDGHSEDSLGEMNRCPKCGNTKVRVGYPEITCMACGHSEPLVDYPISYREHRAYCYNFHQEELIAAIPWEPAHQEELTARGIETRIDKVQSQVNMLMGQAAYRQQKKAGLQRIDV